jgi:hypothetical protein
MTELQGFRIGESRRSVNPKENVELRAKINKIRQDKYQAQICEKME